MAKVFSSIVKEQIMNHHPERLIFQGELIKVINLDVKTGFSPFWKL
jgi:hypothetical protein